MAKRKIPLVGAAICVALSIAATRVPEGDTRPAQAADLTTLRAPKVALLATHPGAELTSLFLVDVRDSKDLAPVSTFGHLPDAIVRAAIVPGKSDVFATADTTPSRDMSFNASLFHLRPHTPPQTLVDRVVHASRPLVTPAGRVFVSRGKPGPFIEGKMRVDSLSIDEIDPASAQSRTVHHADGYLLFLAGQSGAEIVVYRVFPNHADIVAVHADTGKERTILKDVPPFARDFSVDAAGKYLVFQNRHENDSRTWVIDRVDITTGKTDRLHSSESMTLAPFILPNGGVLYNPSNRGLLALQGAAPIAGPLGAGVDVGTSVSSDGRYLAALHTLPSSFAVPFVVDTSTGSARVLPAPANTRVELAGFVEQGGAQ